MWTGTSVGRKKWATLAVFFAAAACGSEEKSAEPAGTGGSSGGLGSGGASTAVGGSGGNGPAGTTGGDLAASGTGGIPPGAGATGAAGASNAAAGGAAAGGASQSSATGGSAGEANTGESAGATAAVCATVAEYEAPDLSGALSTVTEGSGNGLFEGAVWLADRGVLLFSDMTFSGEPVPSEIRELTPPDSVRTLAADSGTNGLALDIDGAVLGGAHDVQGIIRIDPVSGQRSTLVDEYQGNSFNSPNDLTVRSDGTIYFTDPDFQLGQSRTSETGMTGVYRVTPTREVLLVDGDLANPNGISLAPDETVLYVNTGDGQVWTYEVSADGSTGERQQFASVQTPDGMAVDCAGNLYVASHNGGVVQVLAPDGSSLGTITIGPQVTNLAFGGAQRTTLYITAGKTLFSMPMNLPGYPY